MSLDWLSIDRELVRQLTAWRHASGALRRTPHDDARNPLEAPLLDRQLLAQVDAADDELARALSPWLHALASERDSWSARCSLSGRWHELHMVTHDEQQLSLATLRERLLTADSGHARAKDAAAFARLAGALSDVSIDSLEQRFEREGSRTFLMAAGCEEGLLLRAAEHLLSRTDDAAGDAIGRGWATAVHQALGTAATEGWPARLRPRWLHEVFATAPLTDGLHIELGPLPRAWGATSFARALGQLGVAALEAGRPLSLPFAMHQHAFGTRRHQRFALFASLVGELAFAQRAMGLGRERALRHQRAVATAQLCSLRIDAMRVLVIAALYDGKKAAGERFAETSERLFGEQAPPSLIATLPQLRPATAACLIGTLLAAEQRQQLVARFDEDWFRNPHAISRLRELDAAPRNIAPLEWQRLEQNIDGIGRAFDKALA